MIHDNSALTVSQDEATRVEEEAKRRLLASRKLTLVVDLDQTIIHATVDPTVAEWQQDKDNPNHEAVKEVRAFQLIDDGPGARGCWYYIKLRPGLTDFLQNIAKLYELHIYTMGTRLYAQNIREIVDPTGALFGDRILSRDESGSLTAKNLQRLFPIDTKMVVIIDDRGDVWKWNDNLIKVTPYDFFVGIGDINSSFLPKKPEIQAALEAQLKGLHSKKEKGEGASPNENGHQTNGDDSLSPKKEEVSALEQLVTMSGGDDPKVLELQTQDQEVSLAAQLEHRPLLQQQKKLDAEDEAAEAAANGEKPENAESDVSSDSGKHRHNLLQDNDTELTYLEGRLRQVHQTFFDEYDRKRAGAQGGRLSALRGEPKASVNETGIDLSLVPDIKNVMPSIKLLVLRGAVLVLSGVVPLGADVQNSDIALWAKSFGAKIHEKVSKYTTHVVAGRNRTAKVRQAAKRPHIHIVTISWLQDSVTQWNWLDEEPYLVAVHPDDRQGLASSGASSQGSKDGADLEANGEAPSLTLSTDEETGASTDEESNPTPKLVIKTRSPKINTPEDEPELSNVDLESPIGGSPDNWAAMHDELVEFMGSETESDSDASVVSNASRRRKKRKLQDDDEDEDNDEGQDGSDLRKNIKRSHARSTGLRAVQSIESQNPSGDDFPAEEEDQEAQSDDGAEEEDEEDDLEAALEKALQEGD
jgi:RNA polymerase II subunit A C-terminal domain phosphatase